MDSEILAIIDIVERIGFENFLTIALVCILYKKEKTLKDLEKELHIVEFELNQLKIKKKDVKRDEKNSN